MHCFCTNTYLHSILHAVCSPFTVAPCCTRPFSYLTSLTPPPHLPRTPTSPPSHPHLTSLAPPPHLPHTPTSPPSYPHLHRRKGKGARESKTVSKVIEDKRASEHVTIEKITPTDMKASIKVEPLYITDIKFVQCLHWYICTYVCMCCVYVTLICKCCVVCYVNVVLFVMQMSCCCCTTVMLFCVFIAQDLHKVILSCVAISVTAQKPLVI